MLEGMTPGQIALAVAAAIGVIVVTALALRAGGRHDHTAAPAYVPSEVIARIEGQSTFTFGGGFAAVMMGVLNFTALLTYYSASTILQQTVAVLGAISASVFWGVFVIVGRKHTYRVLREPDPVERVEPRA
jgi:hypothetical protein